MRRTKVKRYRFCIDDGSVFDCIARDFRAACLAFDATGIDPRQIDSIEAR